MPAAKQSAPRQKLAIRNSAGGSLASAAPGRTSIRRAHANRQTSFSAESSPVGQGYNVFSSCRARPVSLPEIAVAPSVGLLPSSRNLIHQVVHVVPIVIRPHVLRLHVALIRSIDASKTTFAPACSRPGDRRCALACELYVRGWHQGSPGFPPLGSACSGCGPLPPRESSNDSPPSSRARAQDALQDRQGFLLAGARLARIVVAIHERLCQKDLRLRIGWLPLQLRHRCTSVE